MFSKSKSLLSFKLTMMFVLMMIVSVGVASAAVFKQIPYTGMLKTSGGANVSDGNYAMEFNLYTVSAGGVSVWSENYGAVTVSDGLFSVLLGSINSFEGDGIDFSADTYYLGISVNGNAEMTPRQRVGANAYAINSSAVEGAVPGTAADNILQLGSNGEISLNSYIEGLDYMSLVPGVAPLAPSDGQIYYDNGDDTLYGRIGGAWLNLGAAAGATNTIGEDDTDIVISDSGVDGNVVIRNNGSETMRINERGHVGFNSSSSLAQFFIQDLSDWINGAENIVTTGSTTVTTINDAFAEVAIGDEIKMLGCGGRMETVAGINSSNSIDLDQGLAGCNGAFQYRKPILKVKNGNGTSIMTLTSSGRLGINTETPRNVVEFAVTADATRGMPGGMILSDPDFELGLYGDPGGDFVRFAASTPNTSWAIGHVEEFGSNPFSIGVMDDANVEFYTNSTKRMSIAGADGEVTIDSISADGVGKVVCIKADGSLGTCSDAPDGTGACTCN